MQLTRISTPGTQTKQYTVAHSSSLGAQHHHLVVIAQSHPRQEFEAVKPRGSPRPIKSLNRRNRSAGCGTLSMGSHGHNGRCGENLTAPKRPGRSRSHKVCRRYRSAEATRCGESFCSILQGVNYIYDTSQSREPNDYLQ